MAWNLKRMFVPHPSLNGPKASLRQQRQASEEATQSPLSTALGADPRRKNVLSSPKCPLQNPSPTDR